MALHPTIASVPWLLSWALIAAGVLCLARSLIVAIRVFYPQNEHAVRYTVKIPPYSEKESSSRPSKPVLSQSEDPIGEVRL